MKTLTIIEQFVSHHLSDAIRIDAAPSWITALEQRVGLPLSKSYKLLLTHYLFDTFETDEITFFYNMQSAEDDDIQQAIFKDDNLFNALKKASMFHIGFPQSGSYDPICFDTNKKTNNGDYPIVRIDHEQALMYQHVVVLETIAPSFYAYIKAKSIEHSQ